jgi:hypothetical protein
LFEFASRAGSHNWDAIQEQWEDLIAAEEERVEERVIYLSPAERKGAIKFFCKTAQQLQRHCDRAHTVSLANTSLLPRCASMDALATALRVNVGLIQTGPRGCESAPALSGLFASMVDVGPPALLSATLSRGGAIPPASSSVPISPERRWGRFVMRVCLLYQH